ncbi:SDR family NAD(P)-dependent oxidoreductase [Cupriavidus plantarum]|uniref:SDR family NAD(P)-dependent oxidoreductase n=1 Tax=Cupriavidus plantarum TaxID=942865 RepID=UPI000E26B030|nr:SDR family NAD(P)-dependent oxidoreductase [Cupriavidus plantarum]NYI02400.1 NAD(P)-dependent dehydrogenase (short-subunit alcohol dehydrogenase family) [Cupriavidus plantarum]REE85454.1 NAD(P)-dependent dehydrogenase (short-subunit alcohol dehydrogenase family) [Cupriavidus plantarum]
MDGKVVVVTGACGGIGRGIALALAQAGAKVVVNDVGVSLTGEGGDTTITDRLVEEIRAAGGTAVANTDSVTTWQGAANIVASALDHFGRIDGVINNAGNLRDRFFHNMNEEEWRAVIDVHLHGTFFVSRAAAPHFKAQNGGAYVHMTSTSGLIGNFGQANYSAAKLGIAALSKSIALDMQKFNVRSNCIAPFAWSRMTDSIPASTPEEAARVEKLKKMEAHKIAPMAVYLVSDAASAVSGQIFGVRANEILLFSQPRPVRSVHCSDGWTPERIAEVAIPAMQTSFHDLERSPDVVCWDPI